MNVSGWSKGLEVTAGGGGVVSHAGLVLLRRLADKTGLTAGLSKALASPRLLIRSGCAHARCWVQEAHVTELTGLLREGPDGDHLAGWPASMRIFARRERPHPGAQLSLFEEAGGWRYSLWVANLPVTVRGWRGQLAYIDAAHRVHARVENCIRTGKDTGIGKFPPMTSRSTPPGSLPR